MPNKRKRSNSKSSTTGAKPQAKRVSASSARGGKKATAKKATKRTSKVPSSSSGAKRKAGAAAKKKASSAASKPTSKRTSKTKAKAKAKTTTRVAAGKTTSKAKAKAKTTTRVAAGKTTSKAKAKAKAKTTTRVAAGKKASTASTTKATKAKTAGGSQRTSTLQIGDVAPDFVLESDNAGTIRASDLRGTRYVLYFYPRDNTPGCTREACDFQARGPRFETLDVPVYGVSSDSLDSHRRFREAYGLGFGLLSDPDNEVAKAYGAYGQKVLYGKSVTGTIRSTFVIGPEGRVERIYSPVKVDDHAEAVLEAVQAAPPS